MQNHFVVSEVVEREQAAYFSLLFGVDLERIPQGPGVTGDYRVVETSEHTEALEEMLGYPLTGKLIEFKNDIASLKYNSFYVEYQQTSDFWFTRKQSGHDLAIARGCVLVVSSGPKCFVFNETAYAEFIEGVTRERTTKYRKNGNAPGSYTRGKIVPLKVAEHTASFVYDMSVQAGPQAIPF